jgi:hypothetical protein
MSEDGALAAAETSLRQALDSAANASGGWGYYARKSSRLEPTCWSLLALGAPSPGLAAGSHLAFLTRAQQASGWLAEGEALPISVCFNALAAFTLASHPDAARGVHLDRLLGALVASKGVKAPPTDGSPQDNSLQGWSWIDETFSWVEPTAWGLLALKRAQRAGTAPAGSEGRIAEAERLLLDRVCRDGGWNYGNASVLDHDLRPYVPTTALSLLALQHRRGEPAVARSLAFLEAHWADEVSAVALGLALICLDVFGRPTASLESRLASHVPDALAFGNTLGLAVSLLALSSPERVRVFRL